MEIERNFYLYNNEGALVHVCPSIDSLSDYCFDKYKVRIYEKALKSSISEGIINVKIGSVIKSVRVRTKHEKGVLLGAETLKPKSDLFSLWWNKTGSGIAPQKGEDAEEYAKRVSKCFWDYIKQSFTK